MSHTETYNSPSSSIAIDEHSNAGTTGKGLRLPDFLIIGSPKSGTTSLYHYLQRHPGVFMSTPKEMSFFSKDEVFARGLEWYGQLFQGARGDQICGEASTTYSRWPTYANTVDRIAERLPNAKLLYIVRSPVERLYSFYAHRMRDRVTTDIASFLQETPEAIHSGRYYSQIEQYLKRFPREQLHVLLLDDLKSDPTGTLELVRSFLQLTDFNFLSESSVVANRGQGQFAATQSITAAIDRVKRVPGAKTLLNAIPPALRNGAFKWLQRGPIGSHLRSRHTGQLTPLTAELHAQLLEHFQDDLDRFEGFIGRDLSHWRQHRGHAE
ncbi:MAG: sulfotransferase family protein [Aeoliella sp.]